MRNKVKAILLAVATLLGVTALDVAAPHVAGAQSILPCPGGWNGWFDSYDPQTNKYSVVNCSIQGNHIVADSWVGNSYSQGVIDIWFDPSAQVTFTNGSCAGSHCWPFFINFRRAGNPLSWDMGVGGSTVPTLQKVGNSCTLTSYSERLSVVSTTDQYQLGISTQNCTVNPTFYEYPTGAFATHRPYGTNGGHRTVSVWEMIFDQGNWYVPQQNLSRVGVAWA